MVFVGLHDTVRARRNDEELRRDVSTGARLPGDEGLDPPPALG